MVISLHQSQIVICMKLLNLLANMGNTALHWYFDVLILCLQNDGGYKDSIFCSLLFKYSKILTGLFLNIFTYW